MCLSELVQGGRAMKRKGKIDCVLFFLEKGNRTGSKMVMMMTKRDNLRSMALSECWHSMLQSPREPL